MWGLWKITYFYIIIPRRRKGRWREIQTIAFWWKRSFKIYLEEEMFSLTEVFCYFWMKYIGKDVPLHHTYRSKWLCMGPILGNWLPYPDFYFWQIHVKMSHYWCKSISAPGGQDGEVAVHSGWFRKDSELSLHLSNGNTLHFSSSIECMDTIQKLPILCRVCGRNLQYFAHCDMPKGRVGAGCIFY